MMPQRTHQLCVREAELDVGVRCVELRRSDSIANPRAHRLHRLGVLGVELGEVSDRIVDVGAQETAVLICSAMLRGVEG